MIDTKFYIQPLKRFADARQVQVLPLGQWEHPEWGDILITQDKLERMKKNFDDNVLAMPKLTSNYEHGEDKAKGNKASGVINNLEIKSDGLWAHVDWTEQALAEIEAGEWTYISPEYKDTWHAQHTGTDHTDVLWGLALTNHPFLKGIAPINMSELATITAEVADKEHSEPGTGIGGEPGPNTDYDKIAPPPPMTPPNLDPSVRPPGASTLNANSTGKYLFNEGGVTQVNEAELRAKLGIGENVDLDATLTKLMSDAAAKPEPKVDDRTKAFAEAYPQEHARLMELAERDRKNEARKFAESFTSVSAGEDGKLNTRFTPKAVEQIEAVAYKFSEGSVTLEDFKGVLEGIAKTGVVELSERGSSVVPEGDGVQGVTGSQAGYQLAEMAKQKVAVAAAAGQTISLSDATRLVAQEQPSLFAEYRKHASPAAERVLAGAGVKV